MSDNGTAASGSTGPDLAGSTASDVAVAAGAHVAQGTHDDENAERSTLASAVITAVFCLVIGIVVGCVGATLHRWTWLVGGGAIPLGLIVTGVAALGIFLGIRLSAGARGYTWLAVAAATIVIGFACVQGPGGSVLYAQSAAEGSAKTWETIRTYAGIFEVPLIGVIVASWPRFTSVRR